MCGIAGIVGEADTGLLRRMLDLIRYRGPRDRVRGAGHLVELSRRHAHHADSAIVVMIIVWVDGMDHEFQLASDLRGRIKKRFDTEGIEMPFPQRVVYTPKGAMGGPVTQ